MQRLTGVLLGVALLTWAPPLSFAETYTRVNDPFTDGDYRGGSDPLGTRWFNATSNQLGSISGVVNDGAAPDRLDGNSLHFVPGNKSGAICAFFAPAHLGIGDRIAFSFDYRYLAEPSDTPFSLVFGLFWSSNTRQTADAQYATRADDRGYFTRVNPAHAALDPDQSIWNRVSGDFVTTLGDNIGKYASSFYSSTNRHNLAFTVQRTAQSQIRLTAVFDGVDTYTKVDNTPVTTIYDMAVICTRVVAHPELRFDNMRIETTVPPPAMPGACLSIR